MEFAQILSSIADLGIPGLYLVLTLWMWNKDKQEQRDSFNAIIDKQNETLEKNTEAINRLTTIVEALDRKDAS